MTMKRIISIVLCSLTVLVVMAQGNSYMYWLDEDYSHRQTESSTSNNYSFSLDVKGLSQGMHALNLRAKTQDGYWGGLNRYIFLVPGMEAKAKSIESWIDDNYSERVKTLFTEGNIIQSFKIDDLSKGIHAYNYQVQYADGSCGPVKRQLFLISNHPEDIQLKAIAYWFDDDEENAIQQQAEDASIELHLDINLLSSGTHTFHCRLQNGNGLWSESYSYDFDIANTTDIESLDISEKQESSKIIYSLDGRRLPTLRNGLNIIILSNGTKKKVVK